MEELWSLTNFFGYRTQTFVQAVNLLDRFLTNMKVSISSVMYLNVFISFLNIRVCVCMFEITSLSLLNQYSGSATK